MTRPRDADALLSAYLDEGMRVMPARVVDEVLDEVHRTRQRRIAGRGLTRPSWTTFAAAAIAAAVAFGGAFFVIQRSQPSIIGGPPPTAAPSATPSPAAVPSPTQVATPSPTPTPTASPTPTPTPTPLVVPGGREWRVTVRNLSSGPASLVLAEEGENGMARQCGNVTPSVVPAGVTERVTFLLPRKRVRTCWVWVNPPPGNGGTFFQTSDAPMKGEFLIDAGGQVMWGGQ